MSVDEVKIKYKDVILESIVLKINNNENEEVSKAECVIAKSNDDTIVNVSIAVSYKEPVPTICVAKGFVRIELEEGATEEILVELTESISEAIDPLVIKVMQFYSKYLEGIYSFPITLPPFIENISAKLNEEE